MTFDEILDRLEAIERMPQEAWAIAIRALILDIEIADRREKEGK